MTTPASTPKQLPTLDSFLSRPLEVGEPDVAGPLAVFPIFERELRAYSGGHISEPRRPPVPPQQPSEASLTLDRVSYRQSATVVRNPG